GEAHRLAGVREAVHGGLEADLGAAGRLQLTLAELPVTARQPSEREEGLQLGRTAVDDIDQPVAVDVEHARIRWVARDVDLHVLIPTRLDRPAAPLEAAAAVRDRREHLVAPAARHVYEVDDAVRVEVERAYARAGQRQHAGVAHASSRHDSQARRG